MKNPILVSVWKRNQLEKVTMIDVFEGNFYLALREMGFRHVATCKKYSGTAYWTFEVPDEKVLEFESILNKLREIHALNEPATPPNAPPISGGGV